MIFKNQGHNTILIESQQQPDTGYLGIPQNGDILLNRDYAYNYAIICPQGKQFLMNRGLLSGTRIILSISFDICEFLILFTP